MKSLIFFLSICALITTMVPPPAVASDVTIPNTFQSGTTAVAAEVNANFSAVETSVDDNNSRIAALEATVAALQATVTSQASTISTLQSNLTAVQSSQVMALDSYITVDASGDPRGPLVTLAGANLKIVNGLGSTNSINGLGNLIIGYDEVNTSTVIQGCSDGAYINPTSCAGAGEVWSHSHKSGSHYLVAGSENNYSQYGGIVAGMYNFVTSAYGTVTGGEYNMASGTNSSVSGGTYNTASNNDSSVSGGNINTASGIASSVSGGSNNTAGGNTSSVSGGYNNTASNIDSSVSGGYNNTASGSYSSVSGGSSNTASGVTSNVSGGASRSVSGQDDWRAGSLFETN
jgi:hypothetical protein